MASISLKILKLCDLVLINIRFHFIFQAGRWIQEVPLRCQSLPKVGMSVAGLLDESAPWDKKRGKVPKTNRHTNLSPQKTEAAVPPPVLHVRAVSDGQHALSKRLKQLLQKHNMMGYADLLLRHQLDEEEIALWSLPDLLQLLKSPAKATREFLAELKSQQEAGPKSVGIAVLTSCHVCHQTGARSSECWCCCIFLVVSGLRASEESPL